MLVVLVVVLVGGFFLLRERAGPGYLAAMMGERYLNEMAELKRAFDPNCILGRGNMFNESYLSNAEART